MSLEKLIRQNKNNVYNKKKHNIETDTLGDLYNPTVNHVDRGFDYRDFETEIEKQQDSNSYDLHTGSMKEKGLINKHKIKYVSNYVNIDSSTRIRQDVYNITKYPIVSKISFKPGANPNSTDVTLYVNNTYDVGVGDKIILDGLVGKSITFRYVSPIVYYYPIVADLDADNNPAFPDNGYNRYLPYKPNYPEISNLQYPNYTYGWYYPISGKIPFYFVVVNNFAGIIRYINQLINTFYGHIPQQIFVNLRQFVITDVTSNYVREPEETSETPSTSPIFSAELICTFDPRPPDFYEEEPFITNISTGLNVITSIDINDPINNRAITGTITAGLKIVTQQAIYDNQLDNYMRIQYDPLKLQIKNDNKINISGFKGDILNSVTIFCGTTLIFLTVSNSNSANKLFNNGNGSILHIYNLYIGDNQPYGNIIQGIVPSGSGLPQRQQFGTGTNIYYYEYENKYDPSNNNPLCYKNVYLPTNIYFALDNYNIPQILDFLQLFADIGGINISSATQTNTNDFGNVSTSYLNNTHIIKNNKINNIDDGITKAYFDIELPYNFVAKTPTIFKSGIENNAPNVGTLTYTLSYYTIPSQDITLELQDYETIPLSLLNNDINNPYQLVTNTNNNITFEIPYSISSPIPDYINNNLITLGIIDTISIGNPTPSNYILELGDVFEKIVKIRMVSSCFPTSYNTFGDTNNTFYWQNIDDINIKSFSLIYPKTYTFEELKVAFSVNSKKQNINNELVISRINNEIQIQSLLSYKFISSFISLKSIVPVDAGVNSLNGVSETGELAYVLTIQHINHPFNNGDTIQIQNSRDYLYLAAIDINNIFTLTYIDTNNYSVIVNYTTIPSIITNTIQNPNAQIVWVSPFRIYFDKPNTMGNILGFHNVGGNNSITQYATTINPNTLYINEITKLNDFNKKLKLEPPAYVLMYCDEVNDNVMIVNNAISKINNRNYFFYRINMNNPNGQQLIYDTFADTPVIYSAPLRKIKKFNFSFFTPDNKPYDFDNVDHSFVLELTTIKEMPVGTEIRD
uniref:Uncharacterized protein n=1 Tax=viral metagenome TaxID=1070528 RepID=A0A6C0E0U6_9ZZZZ